MQPAQQPQNRGFDQAYVLLEGGAAHFKQANMDLQSNYSATFQHNGKPIELPDDFYSSTWFTDRLISAIDAGKASQKPFFAFAAYTAPHWPLQAPDKYLAQYRGRYDQGYEAIAHERLERQRKAGLVPADFPRQAQLEGVPSWASLTVEQQRQSARTMEVYAAMVAALDAEVGRLVDHLRKAGELDNTLILFMSDNGPENATRVDPNWIKQHFDNNLDNYGKPDSFLMIGPAWAQVSALPSRRYKMTTYQAASACPPLSITRQRSSLGAAKNWPASETSCPPCCNWRVPPCPASNTGNAISCRRKAPRRWPTCRARTREFMPRTKPGLGNQRQRLVAQRPDETAVGCHRWQAGLAPVRPGQRPR